MDKKCQHCENLNVVKPAYYVYSTPSRDCNYICKACSKQSFFRRFYPEAHLQPLDSKNVRRYNLPLDHKYTLVGIEYLGSLLDGGGSSCENCGKLIVNVATVKTEQGNVYGIGLDCAETLSFTDNTTYWKLKEAEAKHNKMMGWARKVKQAKKDGKTITSEHEDGRATVLYNGMWQFRLTDKVYKQYFNSIIT